MENMFKKTLLALAVTGLAGNAMAAADLAGGVTTRTVSVEGAGSLTQVAAPAVVLTFGAEYTVGDFLIFTFAGADLDTTVLPTSVNPVNTADANDTMTLGLINSSTTSATYRVTELTFDGSNAETTVGATVTFAAEADLLFDAADVLASGSVSVTYNATTSTGLALDTPAGTDGTATLIDTSTQVTAVVTTPFAETIDVEQDRLAFVDGSDAKTTDLILVTPTNDSASTEYDATVTGITYTINGDFSILDDDADTAGVQLNNAAAITIGGGGSLTSVDATSIVVDHAGVAAQTITIDVSDDATNANATAVMALAEQTFTVDVNVQYTDHGTDEDSTNPGVSVATADSDALSGATGGGWDLNGSVVDVPYMPFGPATQPIIRHTNNGTQTGDISLRYMVEGVDSTWQDGGVLVADAGPGVRNLLTPVKAALLADGYDSAASGFKATLEITTNVPDLEVTVFAAAKVTTSDSDRLTVGAFQ
jgi:hypothetical protein